MADGEVEAPPFSSAGDVMSAGLGHGIHDAGLSAIRDFTEARGVDSSSRSRSSSSSSTVDGAPRKRQGVHQDGSVGKHVDAAEAQSALGADALPGAAPAGGAGADDTQSTGGIAPRRPLAFHRSLTSPSPSQKLGALRHPSQQSIHSLGEEEAHLPSAQGRPAHNLLLARRNTAPRAQASYEPNNDGPIVSAAEPIDPSSPIGSPFEVSSSSWSNRPEGVDELPATISQTRSSSLPSPSPFFPKTHVRSALDSARPADMANSNVPIGAGTKEDHTMLRSKAPCHSLQQAGQKLQGSDPFSILADTLQLPIATLLQLIPPHLLDPSHERLAPLGLQVPVTSVQALLESCRTLNWICTHLSVSQSSHNRQDNVHGSAVSSLHLPSDSPEPVKDDFDLFELVQRVCDLVCGQAAEKDIDIVLLQDVGDKYLNKGKQAQPMRTESVVRADEGAVRFIFMQLMAQTINAAPNGSTIEIQLEVIAPSEKDPKVDCKLTVSVVRPSLGHAASLAELATGPQEGLSQINVSAVLEPFIHALGGTFSIISNEKGVESDPDLMLCRQLRLPFEKGQLAFDRTTLPPDERIARQRFLPALRLAEEPSAYDLSHFVQSTLAGSRLALHGKPSTSFVRHLTSFFSSCNCESAVLSTEDPNTNSSAVWTSSRTQEGTRDADLQRSTRTAVALTGDRPSLVSFPSGLGMGNEISKGTRGRTHRSTSSAVLDPVTGVPVSVGPMLGSPMTGRSENGARAGSSFIPFSFILIDDDLDVLQRELLRIRAAISTLRSVMSTNSASKDSAGTQTPGTHAIIFFFSLINYRPVRDAIQAIVESTEQSNAPMPEIMMVPKPCGVRRLLTALHTAWEKPMVDPFFSPIATSPMYPSSRRLTKDTWGSTVSPPPIRATTPPHAENHSAPMERETRAPPLHIDLPQRPTIHNEEAGGENGAASASSNTPENVISSDGGPSGRVDSNSKALSTEPGAKAQTTEEAAHSKLDAQEREIGSKGLSAGAGAMLSTPQSSAISTRSGKSPMTTDALEYFSNTAAKLSEDGAAGFMIQSPDGRPAGIFFQPKPKSLGSQSSRPGSSNRRAAIARRAASSNNGDVSTGLDRSKESDSSLNQHNEGHLDSLMDTVVKTSSVLQGHVPMQRDLSSSSTTIADAPADKDSAASHAGSNVSTGSAQISRIAHDHSAPQGKMYEPQVGIQTILAGNRPPTAMPLSLSMDNERTKLTKPVQSRPSVKSDDKPALEVEERQMQLNSGPSDEVTHAMASPANGSAYREGLISPTSGEATLAARQLFGGPQISAAKPSAQPQPGVLIGAGFEATRKKTGMNNKKATKSLEILPPIKVLIVDDNPINVKILSAWLEKRKIKIGVARDGREAVHEWQTGGYHLILMDIQLPVMDGIEATKEIRRLEREASVGTSTSPSVASAASGVIKDLGVPASAAGGGGGSGGSGESARSGASTNGAMSPATMLSSTLRSSVIIVALTASVLNSDRVAALAAGCNDFLNKPVNMRWLERKVTEWGSMQYLIGFRAAAGLEGGRSRSKQLGHAQPQQRGRDGSLLHPNDGGQTDDANLVRHAFGHAPERIAREVAQKLHIGGARSQKAQ